MIELKELQERLISSEREIVTGAGNDLVAPIKLFDTFRNSDRSIAIVEYDTLKGYRYNAYSLEKEKDGLSCSIVEVYLDEKYVFLHRVDIETINRLREELKRWTNIQFGYKVLNPNWKEEAYYDFGLHGVKTPEEAESLLVSLVKNIDLKNQKSESEFYKNFFDLNYFIKQPRDLKITKNKIIFKSKKDTVTIKRLWGEYSLSQSVRKEQVPYTYYELTI